MVKILAIVIAWLFVTLSVLAESYELPEPAIALGSRGYKLGQRDGGEPMTDPLDGREGKADSR